MQSAAMHRTARIAFQGVAGAFSHEACLACAPGFEPAPYPTFAEVFSAAAHGDCARAFVPVENSSAGPVPEVAALLPASALRVLQEHDWPVRLHLMAGAGTRLEDVAEVASHPMALKQCARFLAARGWRATPAFDTAGAAAELAATPDAKRAVVAARPAAGLYGLSILLEDVQDEVGNTTRFLVLAPPRTHCPEDRRERARPLRPALCPLDGQPGGALAADRARRPLRAGPGGFRATPAALA